MAGAGVGVAGGERQELRIAPVMTGGTSLSVWMGGVTCELYCLLAGGTAHQVAPPPDDGSEPEPSTVATYRHLLALAHLEPRVDVITGTSAGGLNGTLLAAAWRNWVPAAEFARLRKTWLDLADLEKLLRRPTEADPPSLLKGDAYFRAEIEKVLTDWRTRGTTWKSQVPADSPDHPLDLLITVTTVDAEARSRRDDYGESISDVNHAHRLLFQTEHVSPDDAKWPEKLAIASRTSACIPGVFEPSYLPIGATDAQKSGLPDFAEHASFQRSHFAVDGGVVVNLPLREALERVFYQPADAPVRRVVMFVQPTPKTPAQAAVQHDAPPTIRESVLTVVSAPRAEGITAEVDRIRQHNEAVQRQAAARRSLDALIGPGLVAQADALMPAYRDQRARASVRRTSGYVVRELDATQLETRELEDWLYDVRVAFMPTSVSGAGTPVGPEWAWGIATVEHVGSMVLNLIRTARPRLQMELQENWATMSELAASLDEIREHDRAHWVKRLGELGTIVSRDMSRTARQARHTALAALHARLVALDFDDLDTLAGLANVIDILGVDDPRPRDVLSDPELRKPVIVGWAWLAYTEWPIDASTDAAPVARPATLTQVRAIYEQVVDVLVEVGTTIRAAPVPDQPNLAEQHLQLLADLDTLAPVGMPAAELAIRLRAIHVLQTLLMGDVVAREQVVELQVVSWNAIDHLTHRETDAKLAGPELARLGAFLKRSWRANDWFWGRMDGASRLTEVLLAPHHLHRALRRPGSNAQDAVAAFTASSTFADCTAAQRSVVRDELLAIASADDARSAPRPDTTIEIVARHLQYAIAREELPHVYEAVRHSRDIERSNELNGARFLERYALAEQAGELDVDTTRELLKTMRVGEETVGTELGYGLLNRTMSRGSAVAVNALSSERAGVPLLAKFLKPLRTPLHTVNSVIGISTSPSPLLRFVTALVFAVAGALVGLRVAGVDVATPLVLAAEILLAVVLLAALARSGFLRLLAPFALVATVLGLTIVGSEIDEVLFSEAPPPITGAVPVGSVVDLGEDTIVRITRTSDGTQIVDDVEAGSARIEIRAGAATWTKCKAGTAECLKDEHVAPWKQRMFTEDQIARWVIFALSLIGIFAAAAPATRYVLDGARPTWRRAAAGAGFVGLVAFSVWLVAVDHFHSGAEWLLTGPSEGAPGFKSGLSTVATELGEYRVEVVALTMIAVAVLAGIAYDLTVRRWFRLARVRLGGG